MVNYHAMIVGLNGLTENQTYGDGEPKDTHGYTHLSIQIKKNTLFVLNIVFFCTSDFMGILTDDDIIKPDKCCFSFEVGTFLNFGKLSKTGKGRGYIFFKWYHFILTMMWIFHVAFSRTKNGPEVWPD